MRAPSHIPGIERELMSSHQGQGDVLVSMEMNKYCLFPSSLAYYGQFQPGEQAGLQD